KQILVTFTKEDTVKKIFREKEPIWSLYIQEFAARILPVDPYSNDYRKRNAFAYKLSGVPLNCNYRDLEPILKKLKAKSCVIDKPKSFGCNYAYIYVDKDDYKKDIFTSWNIFETKIYCTAADLHVKVYGACGNPTHNATQ